MKNKPFLLAFTFIAGAIIGAAIFWMICNYCCHKTSCQKSCCEKHCAMVPDTSGIRQIDVPTANGYFRAYLKAPKGVDTLKAFTINLEQFNAMKVIAREDTSVHGFRIYMGLDIKTPIRMVVGTGSPDKTKKIIVTSDVNSGACPDICDKSSPIMQ